MTLLLGCWRSGLLLVYCWLLLVYCRSCGRGTTTTAGLLLLVYYRYLLLLLLLLLTLLLLLIAAANCCHRCPGRALQPTYLPSSPHLPT